MDSPFISADEIGRRLGIHPNTVLRYAKAGIIPSKQASPRRTVFLRADVERWMRGLNEHKAVVAPNEFTVNANGLKLVITVQVQPERRER